MIQLRWWNLACLMGALGVVLAPGCGDDGGTIPLMDSGVDAFSCTPDAFIQCDGDMRIACNAAGDGTVSETCENGCNETRGMCNECTPGETVCDDATTLSTCSADGLLETTTCDFGCSDLTGAAACNECNPSTIECVEDAVVDCAADGTISSSEDCPAGCNDTLATPACFSVVPSNLSMNICTTPGSFALVVNNTLEIDTDADCTNVHTPASGPDICVLKRTDVTVPEGTTLTASGSRPLALVATGEVVIDGTVDVSAVALVDGPGAVTTGEGQAGTAVDDGAGGAGHLTSGAPGGNGQSFGGGSGGIMYGSPDVVPLQGGSPGGDNTAPVGAPERARGGGGGGAIQIVGCGNITIGATAVINAGGGGGEGGGPGTDAADPAGGGGGGGAGGSILIEGGTVTLASGALLAANGGGGGGGGSIGASATRGEPGEDALEGTDKAPGGPAASAGAGAGGVGGVGGGTGEGPLGGQNATVSGAGAGGAGGAAGRIRINVAPGTTPDDQGAVSSPTYTPGPIAVQ